jgi:hypothetical protein
MKSLFTLVVFSFLCLVGSASVKADAQEKTQPDLGLIESIARIKRVLSENSYFIQNAVDPTSDRMVRDVLVEDLIRKIKQLRKIESLRSEIRHLEELLSDNDICASFEQIVDPATNESFLEVAHKELSSKKEELNELNSLISKENPRLPAAADAMKTQKTRAFRSIEPMPLGDY